MCPLDLSQPLYHDAPNCPVHPPVVFKTICDHAGTGWRMEEIAMATHTGSHLDAPLHKIAGGASIEFWALPLNWPGCSGAFCRPVIELP